jgi:hypothetical protein
VRRVNKRQLNCLHKCDRMGADSFGRVIVWKIIRSGAHVTQAPLGRKTGNANGRVGAPTSEQELTSKHQRHADERYIPDEEIE